VKPGRWLLVAGLLVLAACAPGVNEQLDTGNAQGAIAGFWLGLWHGLIAPITFLVSLFTTSVRIYEVHNVGRLYDFGYVLGLMVAFGGPARGAWRRRR
jgi:hypothetical protein